MSAILQLLAGGLVLLVGLIYIFISKPNLIVWVSFGLLVVGFAMNFLVIVSNGGQMPICLLTTESFDAVNYHQVSAETQFKYLADCFSVSLSESLVLKLSLGDIILASGFGLLVVFYRRI